MDEELNESEEQMLRQMETMGRWDGLTYELTLLIPCIIIVAISLNFESMNGVLTGAGVFAGFRLWVTIRQDQMAPTIRSAILKLRKNSQNSA